MGSVVQLHNLWTKTGLAAELALDKKRTLKVMGSIPPDGITEKGYDGYFMKTAIPILYGLNRDPEEGSSVSPENLPPKDRKDWYDGTKTKISIEENAGNFIPVDEVRRGMATLINNMVQEIENLPDLFERDCGFEPEAIKIAQQAVDRVRQLAYERVVASRTEP